MVYNQIVYTISRASSEELFANDDQQRKTMVNYLKNTVHYCAKCIITAIIRRSDVIEQLYTRRGTRQTDIDGG